MEQPATTRTPLTEEWLRATGFRWEQLERQPSKQWLLWLGAATQAFEGFKSPDDLGVEVAEVGAGQPGLWHVWLRADYCGRYTRFLHVRYASSVEQITSLIEAITGQAWDPANVMYGCLHTPESAAQLRRGAERLDQRLAREWGQRVERREGLDPAKREVIR